MIKCSKSLSLLSLFIVLHAAGLAKDEKNKKLSTEKAPELKISGTTAISTGFVNQNDKRGGKGGGTPQIGIGVSDIYFTVTGESSEGLTYKWRSNITAMPGKSAIAIDRNFLEFGHKNFGTFQIGAVSGVEDTMAQSATRIIGGAAGIDGAFAGMYNLASGVVLGVHPVAYTKRATKIVYLTPRMEGVQFGVAYTPHTGHSGRQARNLNAAETEGIGHDGGLYDKKHAAYGINNLAVGLSYANAWEDFSFAAAITYLRESSKSSLGFAVNNASAYQVGMTLGYKDVRFATSYMNNGKSRLPTVGGVFTSEDKKTTFDRDNLNLGNSGRMFDVGAQYTMNQYKFAVGYFNSIRKFNATEKTKGEIVTITTDYSFLPGLSLFGEIDFARSKSCKSAVDLANKVKNGSGVSKNSARAVLVGAKLSF
ncbi:MAG: hypothetical protein CNLJKLNK_00992 [Holosporales bacterium]